MGGIGSNGKKVQQGRDVLTEEPGRPGDQVERLKTQLGTQESWERVAVLTGATGPSTQGEQ